jgi:hypothetical protein
MDMVIDSDNGTINSIAQFNTRMSAPGTRFFHASIEADVLGLVLRSAVGKSISEYVYEIKTSRVKRSPVFTEFSCGRGLVDAKRICYDARVRRPDASSVVGAIFVLREIHGAAVIVTGLGTKAHTCLLGRTGGSSRWCMVVSTCLHLNNDTVELEPLGRSANKTPT